MFFFLHSKWQVVGSGGGGWRGKGEGEGMFILFFSPANDRLHPYISSVLA